MDTDQQQAKSEFIATKVIKPRQNGDVEGDLPVVVHTGRKWVRARAGSRAAEAGIIGHAFVAPIVNDERAHLNKLLILKDGGVIAQGGGIAPVEDGVVNYRGANFPKGPAMSIAAADVVSITMGKIIEATGSTPQPVTIFEFRPGFMDRAPAIQLPVKQNQS